MTKKATAVFTLGAFVLCSTSCITWPTRDVVTTADYPSSKARILKVVTVSGTEYFSSKSAPGRLQGSGIVGTAIVYGERVEIEGPFTEVKKRADGTIYEVVDREGRTYPVHQVVSAGEDKMTVLVAGRNSEWVSIPLSEVRLVRLKRFDAVMTLVAVVGFGFLGIVGLNMVAYALGIE